MTEQSAGSTASLSNILDKSVLIIGDAEREVVITPCMRDNSSNGIEREQRHLSFAMPGTVWLVKEMLTGGVAATLNFCRDRAEEEEWEKCYTYEDLWKPVPELFSPDGSKKDANETDPLRSVEQRQHLPVSFIRIAKYPRQLTSDDKKEVYRLARVAGWTDVARIDHGKSKSNSLYGSDPSIKRNGASKSVETIGVGTGENGDTNPSGDGNSEGQSPKSLNLCVLIDENKGFRNHGFDSKDPREDLNKFVNATHRIWHMAAPLAEGELWERVLPELQKKDRENVTGRGLTIFVVQDADLRQAGVYISDNGSTERTIEEFVSHLRPGSKLSEMAHLGDIVVHFEYGILHYSRVERTITVFLENSYLHNTSQPIVSLDQVSPIHPIATGRMGGDTLITTASLAFSLLYYDVTDDVTDPSSVGSKPEPYLNLLSRFVGYGARLALVLHEVHFVAGYGDDSVISAVNSLQESEQPAVRPRPFYELFYAWMTFCASKKFGEQKPHGQKILNKGRLVQEIVASDSIQQRSKIVSIGFNIREIDHVPEAMVRAQHRFRYQEYISSIAQKVGGDRYQEWFSSAEKFAEKIVQEGLDRIDLGSEVGEQKEPFWAPPLSNEIPIARFGSIETIFKDEIDQYCSIELLMADYLSSPKRSRPLCLAVFGAPGSGKSFTIKQILKRVDPKMAEGSLTFNLSQFDSLDDLTVAFHQVQDKAGEGVPPLVFFDEFDCSVRSRRWHWLKYFLSPMQDGTYKDGSHIYRVGRAIFVFAGGISKGFMDFMHQKEDAFVDAKGPDFVSRLRGYLDISGINHPEDSLDSRVMFRRAIILRSIIKERLPKVYDKENRFVWIHSDVIRAFLRVREYRHGVRSMEAIVEMSHVPAGEKRFLKSAIPVPRLLAMHVDDTDFLQCLG